MEEMGNENGSLGQMRDKCHHCHPQQQHIWLQVLLLQDGGTPARAQEWALV